MVGLESIRLVWTYHNKGLSFRKSNAANFYENVFSCRSNLNLNVKLTKRCGYVRHIIENVYISVITNH